jgi:p-hydroxybenzoate 3-monooxygenase
VYGQTEVQRDLVDAARRRGQNVHYEVTHTRLWDLETDRPSVTWTDALGGTMRLQASVVVGCDGSFGPSRGSIPTRVRHTWERTYPYCWLGILADVPPSTDQLIYAWHPEGFALHSMRSASVSRFYLQVPPTPSSATGPTTASGTHWLADSDTVWTDGSWTVDPSPTSRCSRCGRSCRRR